MCFSQCFLVIKSDFRYIVLFGNCMDPARQARHGRGFHTTGTCNNLYYTIVLLIYKLDKGGHRRKITSYPRYFYASGSVQKSSNRGNSLFQV